MHFRQFPSIPITFTQDVKLKFYFKVQVRHENCWGTPRCVCAAASRAGQDVFTIDVCSGRQYINFPICNEHSLKVIRLSDKIYKVIMLFHSLVANHTSTLLIEFTLVLICLGFFFIILMFAVVAQLVRAFTP